MKRTWLLLALAGGCIEAETSQAAFVHVGNISQNGTNVIFERLTNVIGLDVQTLAGLTACDPKSLYAAQQHNGGGPQFVTTYPLYFSGDSGQTWTALGVNAKSAEIACDHAYLATLDSSKRLWSAQLSMNGAVNAWTEHSTTIPVDKIQGGDGSIYGTRWNGAGYDVYRTSTRSVSNANLAWGSAIAVVGAERITGAGTTHTGTDSLAVGNTLAWPRRAFALEKNGTISTNANLLAGNNLWAPMPTGNERYTQLSAAAPNILFGVQNIRGVKHLARIRIEETNCTDGVDNDRNGLVDGEDTNGATSCRQVTANNFCATRADGNYCANRFQPAKFLDQANQNTSLVTCTNHIATIQPGACTRHRSKLITNQDRLPTYDQLTTGDPPNTGRYCNVHWPDGSWGFSWTGATPCAMLLKSKAGGSVASKPGGTIVRAGLYSTTGANHVFAACSNGWVGPAGASGVAPLQEVYNAVGKTTNRCIFQVSAGALPIFDKMLEPSHEISGRGVNPFTHARKGNPVPLAQFGMGGSGKGYVDRFGKAISYTEPAYDNPLDEGRPLYAPANGVVIPNGSRDRDVRAFGCCGTPYQGEIYVKYSIGTDPVYRETFVVYYAHLRSRLVVPGQTVRAGQILGHVGATGATGGFAHLHTGVARLSNTNAHTPMANAGYRVDFQATADSTGTNTGGGNWIDPLGWANGNAYDPWAYNEWNTASGHGFTGIGAWSVDLFKPGKQFRYPTIP